MATTERVFADLRVRFVRYLGKVTALSVKGDRCVTSCLPYSDAKYADGVKIKSMISEQTHANSSVILKSSGLYVLGQTPFFPGLKIPLGSSASLIF